MLLAQINLARAKAAMDSPIMKGFVDRLDEINALADRSPGFVWRLQEDNGNATAIREFDDPFLIVNMSVWKNLETFKRFVYKSTHVELIRNRKTWFDKINDVHQALWWIPIGHRPSVEEGKNKLRQLAEHGPGKNAFTLAKPYAPTVLST